MAATRSAAPKSRLDRLIALRNRLEQGLSGEVPVRDLAALSREYRATLAEIAELSPEKKASDPVDEIAKRRAARGAGSAKGAARPRRKSG